MTYNDIVEYFKSVAVDINPTGTFIHGRRFDGSINYDEPMPQIQLYPFTDNPNVYDSNTTWNIVIGFLDQDDQGNTLEQRQAIISKMDVLSMQFLKQISGTVTVQNARRETAYLILASTLSGYLVSFNIQSQIEC